MKLKDPRLEALVDTAETFTHNDLKEITLAYQCAGKDTCKTLIICHKQQHSEKKIEYISFRNDQNSKVSFATITSYIFVLCISQLSKWPHV